MNKIIVSICFIFFLGVSKIGCSLEKFVDELKTNKLKYNDEKIARITVYWKNGSRTDYYTKKGLSSTNNILKEGISVAVDPTDIPYFSKIDIPELKMYDLQAVDTGIDVKLDVAAKKSNQQVDTTIDIFFENKNDALVWAKNNPNVVKIYIKNKTNEKSKTENEKINYVKTSYNNKILFVAKNMKGVSSKNIKGTYNGKFGCAAMVNKVLKESIGTTLSNNTLSTFEMYNFLEKSKNWKRVDLNDAPPGSIIISPTIKQHGHVGIIGENGIIYSNSSSKRKWDDHFNISKWKTYYTDKKKLPTRVYVYNPI